MTATIQLTIVNGIQVVVPNSLNLITPYVLQEQNDWFEDEIRFVRKLLESGQKIIDVGANYGVYTLSMAHAVGASGRVWAFEPASSTAKLLKESIAANGFAERIVVEQSALSHSAGTAELSLNVNSELNTLQATKAASGASETVPLVTLDECMSRYQWRDIDFMKMDAEGEESNILKGGTKFFADQSPLVLYEIKAGESLHLDLVKNFAMLGYRSYRLVPSLNVLIPFDAEAPADGYLLNLFCCKPDRAKRLADQGLLVDESPAQLSNPDDRYSWQRTIAKLPYGTKLSSIWQQTVTENESLELESALAFYALSNDISQPSLMRFAALQTSFHQLMAVCERDSSYLRLASMARVAHDYGARSIAVRALQKLSTAIQKLNWMDSSEPFLSPSSKFDGIEPQPETIGNWVLASTLEELERLSSFSSFYLGLPVRQRIESIKKLGFISAEMQCRLNLIKKRFGLPIYASEQ